MHVGGVGAGGVLPDPPILTTIANAPVSLLPDDSVGSLLQQLTGAPIAQLISNIAASRPALDQAVVTDLLHIAVSAITEGNVPLALTTLTELVHRSPEHVETLAAEPSLAPIRAQVTDLLAHVTAAAKVEGEVRLADATEAVESARPHASRPGAWNPRDVLPVAAQLLDSGRHSNILLGTDLSQSVINYYGGFDIASPLPLSPRGRSATALAAMPSVAAPWSEAVTGVTDFLKNFAKRSPALLLLVLWVLLGIASAITVVLEFWSVELSLEVWGAGSAGLLGFGTYQRLRASSKSTQL